MLYNLVAPRTLTIHLRVGSSLLGFISGDPKASCSLISVNGLCCFEARAATGTSKMLYLGLPKLDLAKKWFYTLVHQRHEPALKAFGPASTAGRSG